MVLLLCYQFDSSNIKSLIKLNNFRFSDSDPSPASYPFTHIHMYVVGSDMSSVTYDYNSDWLWKLIRLIYTNDVDDIRKYGFQTKRIWMAILSLSGCMPSLKPHVFMFERGTRFSLISSFYSFLGCILFSSFLIFFLLNLCFGHSIVNTSECRMCGPVCSVCTFSSI